MLDKMDKIVEALLNTPAKNGDNHKISYYSVILRLHYVPGGPGSPICSKRTCSLSWNFLSYISLFARSTTSS